MFTPHQHCCGCGIFPKWTLIRLILFAELFPPTAARHCLAREFQRWLETMSSSNFRSQSGVFCLNSTRHCQYLRELDGLKCQSIMKSFQLIFNVEGIFFPLSFPRFKVLKINSMNNICSSSIWKSANVYNNNRISVADWIENFSSLLHFPENPRSEAYRYELGEERCLILYIFPSSQLH